MKRTERGVRDVDRRDDAAAPREDDAEGPLAEDVALAVLREKDLNVVLADHGCASVEWTFGCVCVAGDEPHVEGSVNVSPCRIA